MEKDTPTTPARVPTDTLRAAEKESNRLGGNATATDVIRHWLRLGMKADPHPTALLP